jgi:hypothetical protein
MIELRVTYAKAAARVAQVIKAILASHEWEQYSHTLSGLDFMNAREPFRQFFDVYEGEEWLGIMENVVVEEMRLRGPSFAADPATIDAIVARMERHPNVRLER